jgi:hypothetical protein
MFAANLVKHYSPGEKGVGTQKALGCDFIAAAERARRGLQ